MKKLFQRAGESKPKNIFPKKIISEIYLLGLDKTKMINNTNAQIEKAIEWKAVAILKMGAKSKKRWNGFAPDQYSIGNNGARIITEVPRSGCLSMIAVGRRTKIIGIIITEIFRIFKL